VKLTAGRVKSLGGVDGIADVITSLFLKPTAAVIKPQIMAKRTLHLQSS